MISLLPRHHAIPGTIWTLGLVSLLMDLSSELVHSLLPLWDANETWLVLLAGGMLALFPPLYSLLLQTLKVPLFLFLLALFLRGLALAYRGQPDETGRRWLDRLLIKSA